MTVHDVDVKEIGSGALGLFDLMGQTAEVGGKQRWRD
jgi:hypothetical protein